MKTTLVSLSLSLSLALIFLACPAADAGAADSSRASPPSVTDLLIPGLPYESGKVMLVVDTGKGGKPALEPAHFEAPDAKSARAPAGSGALRVEALAFLPAPREAAQATGGAPGQARPGVDLDRRLAALSRILNSVHRMEGLEYWSASRQRMRTLYAEAWRTDSPEGRARLPDPAAPPAAPGETSSFYAWLRDLTFGGNVFRFDISVGPASVLMLNENVSTMRYLLVPVAPPGRMRSRIHVIPCKEGLLVHFFSTIDVSDIAAKRVFESAGNKALAVLGWFAKEASAAGLAEEARLPVNIEDVPVFRPAGLP
ncbi:hypothetical protein LWX53_03385 [bacterium]|nr:hypothetical protein [bacterium]